MGQVDPDLLARRLRHLRARAPPLPGRGVGRPVRLVALGDRAQARRRAGGPRERARRGRGRCCEAAAPALRAADRRASWRRPPRPCAAAGAADRAQRPRPRRRDVAAAMARLRERPERVRSASFEVDVDRERARVGAWYELFPRSWGGLRGRRGAHPRARRPRLRRRSTCRPIHPIGTTHRKGRNNAPTAEPGEPGSPWAIGGAGGRPHRGQPRDRDPGGPREPRARPPRATTSRSPSTSRSSARPTTRGWPSTPSGSTAAPTAP